MTDGSVKLGFKVIVPNQNLCRMVHGKNQRNIEFLKMKTSALLAQIYKRPFIIWVDVVVRNKFGEPTQMFEEGVGTARVLQQLDVLDGDKSLYQKVIKN